MQIYFHFFSLNGISFSNKLVYKNEEEVFIYLPTRQETPCT
jgi:hypothetical protein